jgi:branched-subunit amino acid ABC-type transport system permease component
MSAFVEAIGFGFVSASIIALGAVGFTLQLGVTNIFNLAYGSAMTVSVFVAYEVHAALHVSIWLAMALAALAGAVLAVLLQLLLYGPFQRRGSSVFTVVMVSLAAGVVLQYTVEAIAGSGFYSYSLPPTRSLDIVGLILTPQQLIIIAIAVAAMAAIHLLLKRSRLGKAMRATAADPELARSSGINTGRIILVTWAISGALCGAAGVTVAINTVVFDPTTAGDFLLLIVAAAVVGGIGEPYGAMLGALCVGLVSEVSALWIPQLKDLMAFALLAIVLLAYPGGIMGGRRTGELASI